MQKNTEKIYNELMQNGTKRRINKLIKNGFNQTMIYMITEKHSRTIKVGYTKDFIKRMASYRTHTTLFEIIDAKGGTPKDEIYYQENLIKLGFEPHYTQGGGIEWFNLPKDMPKARLKNGFLSLDNLISENLMREKGIDIWAEA